MLDKGKLKSFFLIFPNAKHVWIAFTGTIFFVTCMLTAMFVYDAQWWWAIPLTVIGFLGCVWAVATELIAVETDMYHYGRMDEYEAMKDKLEGATILQWPGTKKQSSGLGWPESSA